MYPQASLLRFRLSGRARNSNTLFSFIMSTLSSWLWGTSQLDEAIGKVFHLCLVVSERDGRVQRRLHRSFFQLVQKTSPFTSKYAIEYGLRVSNPKMLCAL
jgi:hypothetical protein